MPLADIIVLLDESAAIIVNDNDREFVQAARMWLDMGEPIGEESAQRLLKIYNTLQTVLGV